MDPPSTFYRNDRGKEKKVSALVPKLLQYFTTAKSKKGEEGLTFSVKRVVLRLYVLSEHYKNQIKYNQTIKEKTPSNSGAKIIIFG